MKAFLITYDLTVPGRDYNDLYEEIKSSGRWWHYLESSWIVITEESPQQIWDRLGSHLDNNDFMLIIEVRCNVQGWLPKDAWDWIYKYIPES